MPKPKMDSSIALNEKVLISFMDLLRAALWQRSCGVLPQMSAGEWEQLFKLARSQTVSAVLFDVVKSLTKGDGPHLQLAASWLTDAGATERTNSFMRSASTSLGELWREAGIDAMILKGLEAAKLYPVPEHRSCGDVDWYFRSEEDFKRAAVVLEESGVRLQWDSDGSLHYVYKGQMMEHHILHLDPQDEVQLLCMYNEHILKHAMVLGVGIRQFCDLALAYKAYAGKYDAMRLSELLKQKKIVRWTALLHAFLVRELGLDPALLPESDDCDWETVPRNDVKLLLRLVLQDGNFGFSKKNRIDGLASRSGLFLRYSPYRFLQRWGSLATGRLKHQSR